MDKSPLEQYCPLTVNETKLFNQIIKEIKTRKYKPEQYSSLIGEHINQHHSFKKKGILVRKKQKKKFLRTLQKYLATQTNHEEEASPEDNQGKLVVDNTKGLNLTPTEVTVLNQVINEIKTEKYKREQYNSLINQGISQHPKLKKSRLLKRKTQRKLLKALQIYLATENNCEEEGNGEQMVQDDVNNPVVDNTEELNSKIDKPELPQEKTISKTLMCHLEQKSKLSVSEVTVLSQVINEIKTGKYKQEEYDSLINQGITQHPKLKKNGLLRRKTQRIKLLKALQIYLDTENNCEEEGNKEQMVQSVDLPQEKIISKCLVCYLEWDSRLSADEVTVLNQVIDEIKTGKYKPEEYSSVVRERINQHQSFKKNNILKRMNQERKLLHVLQRYQGTQINYTEERNGDPPAEAYQQRVVNGTEVQPLATRKCRNSASETDLSSVNTQRKFKPKRAALNVNEHKIPENPSRTARKRKNSTTNDSSAKESNRAQKLSKFEEVERTTRERRNSILADSKENSDEDCATSYAEETTVVSVTSQNVEKDAGKEGTSSEELPHLSEQLKPTENIKDSGDNKNEEEYSDFITAIMAENREEDTASEEIIEETNTIQLLDAHCQAGDDEQSALLSGHSDEKTLVSLDTYNNNEIVTVLNNTNVSQGLQSTTNDNDIIVIDESEDEQNESLSSNKSLQLEENIELWQNVSSLQNISVRYVANDLTASPPKRSKTLILQENIQIDGVKDIDVLCQRIQSVVRFFGASIKNKNGIISLNLLLEPTAQEGSEGNSNTVNSDLITSAQKDEISIPQLDPDKLRNENCNQIENIRSTLDDKCKRLKRRLSRCWSESETDSQCKKF